MDICIVFLTKYELKAGTIDQNEYLVKTNVEARQLMQQIIPIKEGPLTKNGPIDFAQSWTIYLKKSN